MKIARPSLWALLAFVLWVGCVPTRSVWRSEPETRKTENEYFGASLSAYCEKTGCPGFILSLENKSRHDIEVDWGKSVYLKNGVANGGFQFEGIILKDRKSHNPVETVVAYGLLTNKIVPEMLTSKKTVPELLMQPSNAPQPYMEPGEHGIRLVVRADGKEISENLVINILRMEVPE